jgi:cobalt-zinc-cadmium efflux system outer membrane protein
MKKAILFAGLLMCLMAQIRIQGAVQPGLRLPDLLAEARQKNPEILAAGARVQAARARVPQAQSLPDPMGMVELDNEGFKKYMVGEDMSSQVMYSVTQEIPFPGKLVAQGKAAGREADRSSAELKSVEWDVLTRLKTAYYDLGFVYESLDILEKNRSLLDQFVKTAEVKYKTGSGIQADVLKAQVELAKVEEKRIGLEQRKSALEALIRSLLAKPSAEVLGRPEPVVVSFNKSYSSVESLALRNNPELLAQTKGLESSRAQVSAAKYGYLPDLSLTAGYGYRGQLDPMVKAGVGINIPLWAIGKQRNAVKEAQSNLGEAKYSQEAMKQNVLARIGEGYSAVIKAQSLADLYGKTIVPQADATLISAFTQYKVGNIDFLSLVSSFTTLLDYQLQAKEQEAELAKAIASLEQVTGVELSGK